MKCVVDIDSDQPSVIDESTCTTRTDANSEACLWCDLSALIGSSQGLCVSSNIRDFIGDLWESLCAGNSASQSPGTNPEPQVNPIPIPVNPIPIPGTSTNPPTHAPVSSSPVATPPAVNPPPVVPPPDNSGSFAGAFSCATDSSSKMISDQAACNAKVDATSSDGKNCVWCPIPLVGGGCITNSDASSISWMCKSFENIMGIDLITKNLRGVATEGWEILDTSCLGDSAKNTDEEKESCGNRSDKSGNSCIWCDGAGVLGFCVSPSQKDVLGSYMACENADIDYTAV